MFEDLPCFKNKLKQYCVFKSMKFSTPVYLFLKLVIVKNKVIKKFNNSFTHFQNKQNCNSDSSFFFKMYIYIYMYIST